jgi:hypothetical protein
MVYFIKVNNRVKIGYSSNMSKRFLSLKTSNPYSNEIELLLLIDGEKSYEKKLHKKFSDVRICGEWFLYSSEIKDFIKSNLDKNITIDLNDSNNINLLKQIRHNNKLTLSDIGNILNISPQGVKDTEDAFLSKSISIKRLEKLLIIYGYKIEITPL